MSRPVRFRRPKWLIPVAFVLPFLLGAEHSPAPTSRLTDDERNTVEIFRTASRGVVHIEARAVAESLYGRQEMEGSSGTGFVLDKEGRILTAFHLIERMNEIDVILGGGRRLEARLVGTSLQLDIAILQVTASEDELYPLPLGDSRTLQVGQKVIAIGNPFELHNTITVGVVSALNRGMGDNPVALEHALIQTDAAINPGNSGGPLLNSAGEVVGINRAIIEKAENLGFAVPIHLVRRIIPDLIRMGHPYRPQLGFSGSTITPRIARLFGLPVDRGVLVEEVLPGSPAAAAGLRQGERIVILGDRAIVLGGDIITAINGAAATDASQMTWELQEAHPGQTLRLSVYRQGETIEVSIPLPRMQM